MRPARGIATPLARPIAQLLQGHRLQQGGGLHRPGDGLHLGGQRRLEDAGELLAQHLDLRAETCLGSIGDRSPGDPTELRTGLLPGGQQLRQGQRTALAGDAERLDGAGEQHHQSRHARLVGPSRRDGVDGLAAGQEDAPQFPVAARIRVGGHGGDASL
ncbi:MAG: hypothetical protein LKI24_00510 [Acidipropionibacterium sp.]|jgi:hypothetical protein|nr:hypothetical protein [Acidipropionibacterium sp.]